MGLRQDSTVNFGLYVVDIFLHQYAVFTHHDSHIYAPHTSIYPHPSIQLNIEFDDVCLIVFLY